MTISTSRVALVATWCLALAGCGSNDATAPTNGSAQASSGAGGSATASSSSGTSAETSSTGATTDAASSTGSTSSSSGSGGSGGGAGLPPVTGLTKVGTGEYRAFYLVSGNIFGNGNLIGATPLSKGVPLPLEGVPAGLTFVDVQSGLHESLAADVNGHVWCWGFNGDGQGGTGMATAANLDLPTMITKDIKGQPFDKVVKVYSHIGQSLAVKSDGTVWFWGNGGEGFAGDAANVGSIASPTQVPLPAGVEITKLSVSDLILALDSTGKVWSWGGRGIAYAPGVELGTGTVNSTPSAAPTHISALPANIVDIATATTFNYAITATGDIWGWGTAGISMGFANAQSVPAPQSLATTLKLPAPVKAVGCNDETTHVILTDGTLWGWGAAGQGEIGDGQIYDMSKTVSCMGDGPYTPYGAWGGGCLMQVSPVQIVPSVNNFKAIFASPTLGWNLYVMTEDEKLYFMGRDKTGDSGTGVYPGAASGNYYAATNVSATYPDSWNVPLATQVSPLTLKVGVPTLSPYCIANPNVSPCNE